MRGEFLSVGQVAARYAVSLRTLRFYEQEGLLHPIRVGTSRFYAARDRVRLELILKGKRLGFTLAEMRDLIAETPSENESAPVALVNRLSREQIESQLAHLTRQRAGVNAALAELRSALATSNQASP